LKKVKTKFETVQSNLPKEKKKYQFLSNIKSPDSSLSSAMDEVNAMDDRNTELADSTVSTAFYLLWSVVPAL